MRSVGERADSQVEERSLREIHKYISGLFHGRSEGVPPCVRSCRGTGPGSRIPKGGLMKPILKDGMRCYIKLGHEFYSVISTEPFDVSLDPAGPGVFAFDSSRLDIEIPDDQYEKVVQEIRAAQAVQEEKERVFRVALPERQAQAAALRKLSMDLYRRFFPVMRSWSTMPLPRPDDFDKMLSEVGRGDKYGMDARMVSSIASPRYYGEGGDKNRANYYRACVGSAAGRILAALDSYVKSGVGRDLFVKDSILDLISSIEENGPRQKGVPEIAAEMRRILG